jgi:type VI secretion system protein ImpK
MTPVAMRSRARSGQKRVASLAGPLFSLMIVLRRTPNLDALVGLRETVVRLFEDFRGRSQAEGIAHDDVDDATYALAAALDEALLSVSWSGRDAWQRDSLAKRYCNNEFVGMGFYDKLAQARHATPVRTGVVEVFYYCLVAGFRGKFAESPQELERLRDELSKEIGTTGSTLVPPTTAGKAEVFLKPIRSFPMMWIITVALSLVFIFWLVMSLILDGRADGVVEGLKGLLRS